jgi:hypothetical protein
VVFYYSECVFELFLLLVHAHMLIGALTNKLVPNVVHLPTFFYSLFILVFFSVLKREKFVDSAGLGKSANFFIEKLNLVPKFVGKHKLSSIFQSQVKSQRLLFGLLNLYFLYFTQRQFDKVFIEVLRGKCEHIRRQKKLLVRTENLDIDSCRMSGSTGESLFGLDFA